MIKLISFDIGNTLIEKEGKPKTSKLENILNIEKRKFVEQYKKAFQTNTNCLENQVSDFLKQLEIDDEKIYNKVIELFQEEVSREIKISEQKNQVIKNLKKQGYIVIAISNACKHTCEESNLKKQIEALFDKVFYSYEIGYCKPDERIFRYVQDTYKLKGEEILHIGDSLKSDYYGSIRCGWNAILYDPKEKYKDESVRKIRNFEEILRNGL